MPAPAAETVNLGSLFPAAAAVAAMLEDVGLADQRLGRHLDDAGRLAESARGTGWRPLAPHPSLRSGIVLCNAQASEIRSAEPERVRAAFLARGVALTTYAGGVIRLSMPPESWGDRDLDRVRAALQRCS